MRQPMDHQPPRRAFGDVRGQARPERASEYFDFTADPGRAAKKVNRQELLFWLTRGWLLERERKWYRRLWRWLRGRPGSEPVPVGDPSAPADREAAR